MSVPRANKVLGQKALSVAGPMIWNNLPTAIRLGNLLRPGPTAAITKTITITTQRKRILLVELLHAEFAHAHSNNVMRSLCVIIAIVLVIAAVGPGLYSICTAQSAKDSPFSMLISF